MLALTCHIELFVLAHYRESIGTDEKASALWKDVFLYHWREESQHAILDELEWLRHDAELNAEQRDRAVNEYRLAVQTNDNTQGAVNEARALMQKPYKREQSQN